MKAGKTTTTQTMVKFSARLTLNLKLIVVGASVAGCLLDAPSTRTHKQTMANQRIHMYQLNAAKMIVEAMPIARLTGQ